MLWLSCRSKLRLVSF